MEEKLKLSKLREEFGKWVMSLKQHVAVGKEAEYCMIIDEAIKEFPCYPTCTKYGQKMMNISETKSGIRCDLGCFAWKAWFIKWFGTE